MGFVPHMSSLILRLRRKRRLGWEIHGDMIDRHMERSDQAWHFHLSKTRFAYGGRTVAFLRGLLLMIIGQSIANLNIKLCCFDLFIKRLMICSYLC